MFDLHVATSVGGETILDAALVEEFTSTLRGELLIAGDAGYDQARQVWNSMIERRPACIVRCSGAADVVAAVNFARQHALLISVRGGGHNVAGTAVCQGGMMIDLSLMRGVRVDAGARSVRVQGGAVWSDVDRETQLFGLGVPNGYASITGVAGLTLGGGYGAMRRKYGLTCDNLLSADIVTADGQLRVASETENADLFWAIRGGGGNFGIVTSFEFRCHPIGPQVYLCAPLYPMAEAAHVLRQWRDFMATAPEEISSNAAFWSIPATADFPEQLHGRDVVVVDTTYNGDPEEGERATRPLRQLGTPVLDLSGVISYTAAQSAFDPFFPKNIHRYYWKAIHLDHLNDTVIAAIVQAGKARPTPMTLLPIWHFGGAMCRVDPTATAFWNRQAPFMVSFDAVWDDPADTERSIAWSCSAWSAMRDFSSGGIYVNFPGLGEEGQELVKAAYGGNYERLVAIKSQVDPTNLFRLNQNIKPTA
jgi:FAD/FMN-containing dehydrogenase